MGIRSAKAQLQRQKTLQRELTALNTKHANGEATADQVQAAADRVQAANAAYQSSRR
jgi:hypothetical protein